MNILKKMPQRRALRLSSSEANASFSSSPRSQPSFLSCCPFSMLVPASLYFLMTDHLTTTTGVPASHTAPSASRTGTAVSAASRQGRPRRHRWPDHTMHRVWHTRESADDWHRQCYPGAAPLLL